MSGNKNLSGNKGEWSEVYAFIKLLGDGKMHAGDPLLRRVDNVYYAILEILRDENSYTYADTGKQRKIVIQSDRETKQTLVNADDFQAHAEQLLSRIKKCKGSFTVPEIEDFLSVIKCNSLKASSKDKADIHINIYNPQTSSTNLFGYSIKSKLGGNFTLLNASQATNFTYKIVGVDLSDEEISVINTISTRSKISDRYHAITSRGGHFEFVQPKSQEFDRNLRILDDALPRLVGELLLLKESSGESSIFELTRLLKEKNPLSYPYSNTDPYYETKIKRLLTAFVVGMVPKKIWSGEYDADGGYLIVKEDGEILAYHLMRLSTFQNLLFRYSYLERASSGRNKYGKLYRDADSGELLFELNLQVRMGWKAPKSKQS